MTAPQTVADVQHTPGPWAVGGQHRRAAVYAGNTQVAFAREEYDRISSTVAEANARLIAAAPDLRAALSSILPSPLCGESWDLPDEEMVQITVTLGELRAARAALRAAATSARQGETK